MKINLLIHFFGKKLFVYNFINIECLYLHRLLCHEANVDRQTQNKYS